MGRCSCEVSYLDSTFWGLLDSNASYLWPTGFLREGRGCVGVNFLDCGGVAAIEENGYDVYNGEYPPGGVSSGSY